MASPTDTRHHHDRMSGQAWALFAAMSVIWGLPYLFIKIAVEQVPPTAVVFGRTALAAVVLVPVAMRGGALRSAARHWRPVAVFAVLEMGVPWLLLSHSEQRISSALAGLMLAAVPIIGALVLAAMGERRTLAGVRVLGMALGMLGVALLVGLNALDGHLDGLSVLEMLIVATCYAVGPILLDRLDNPVPPIGTIALSVLVVAAVYLPWGGPALLADWPPSPPALLSLLVLGLVCTALAFVLFLRLINAAGPVRAVVITFVNPAVALLLGVVVLGESVTTGMIVGFPIVLIGSWLATRATPDRQPVAT